MCLAEVAPPRILGLEFGSWVSSRFPFLPEPSGKCARFISKCFCDCCGRPCARSSRFETCATVKLLRQYLNLSGCRIYVVFLRKDVYGVADAGFLAKTYKARCVLQHLSSRWYQVSSLMLHSCCMHLPLLHRLVFCRAGVGQSKSLGLGPRSRCVIISPDSCLFG